MDKILNVLIVLVIVFYWIPSLIKKTKRKKSGSTKKSFGEEIFSLLLGNTSTQSFSPNTQDSYVLEGSQEIEADIYEEPVDTNDLLDSAPCQQKEKDEKAVVPVSLEQTVDQAPEKTERFSNLELCFSGNELKKAIIMSEILSPPRAKNPFRS